MDFKDSPDEASYRAQVRAWLAEHAPGHELPRDRDASEDELVALARRWQAAKAAAGYVGITWRKDVGGQGGTPLQSVIFQQEEARYRVSNVPFAVTMGMCVPTIYTYLTPERALPMVRRAVDGEQIWCQLFSEPAAGSDLAGIRTRAQRDGSDWVINGQKVWTSYAHRSDYGILLVRTDPGVVKHKGLTMFYLDMKTPGVDIRPIRTLPGEAEFNEVFLTDVRIPDSQRLGNVGEGWKVSLTTLSHERMAITKPADAPGVDELIALMQALPGESGGTQVDDPSVRDAIARFYVNDMGLELLRMRAQTALSKGQAPGPEAAIGKLVMAKTRQDIGAFALDRLEQAGIAETDDLRIKPFRYFYWWAPGLRIAGGTDEILRNIIAERVLGLPGDLRLDKDLPFNQIK
ncbi:MAG: acyl-CoA dehydrogenase domain protein [Hydrocarboniphaga sp.]|uniref:acyl-CoA dehydrogenase family protein n=1 Tax=Hydrocarboniphaga sp. TaxID=2033016 RepID=UPI00261790B1|nr:acyl-CoA dehydrogenase family protein [Hydrocarboniphaga sp.]MDB5969906.1 acyl-CoA dehydrogenase domain protein [Hydrocarboniphaga sp.]